MFGVSAALTTPFAADGSVDFDSLNQHITTVLSQGCSSVTFFGTTGEGPSVATDTRLAGIRAAIDAQLDPAKFNLALHGASAADVVSQARQALQMAVSTFLLAPPCFYDQPTDDGLFNWYDQVLSALANTPAKVILYHIPQVIGVGLPIDLVRRIKAAYPEAVIGVKDSSGSFENTKKLLDLPDLQILVGDERLLADAVKLGASGAISGVANVFSERLSQVVATGSHDLAINKLVDRLLGFPVTPGVKALVAHKYQAAHWRQTAAPLMTLSDADYQSLANAYNLVTEAS